MSSLLPRPLQPAFAAGMPQPRQARLTHRKASAWVAARPQAPLPVAPALVAGALAGAAVGAVIGNYQDRQIASRAEAARRDALASQPKLEVESNVNNPNRVAAGAPVESQVGYTVLMPASAQDVKVTESRVPVRGHEQFRLSKREVVRPQGSHVSTLKFTLPKDLPAGDYALVTTIASGPLSRSVRSPLRVG